MAGVWDGRGDAGRGRVLRRPWYYDTRRDPSDAALCVMRVARGCAWPLPRPRALPRPAGRHRLARGCGAGRGCGGAAARDTDGSRDRWGEGGGRTRGEVGLLISNPPALSETALPWAAPICAPLGRAPLPSPRALAARHSARAVRRDASTGVGDACARIVRRRCVAPQRPARTPLLLLRVAGPRRDRASRRPSLPRARAQEGSGPTQGGKMIQ